MSVSARTTKVEPKRSRVDREEWLIALAELGRGDAVEPPVDGVRSEVERREMEG
jgi:hypothetical protein